MQEKFVHIQLKERNGEYEYTHNLARELPEDTTPTDFAEELASEWYEGKSEKADDGYYYHGGSVHVSVKNISILEEEFIILSKYL